MRSARRVWPNRALDRRWLPILAAGGLFLLALLVRLYRLDAQSLWLDEGSSWELSRAGWAGLLGELFNPNAAYPLYHLLLKAWMALFGDSEWALRLPSALAGALAVVAVYGAGVELERAERAAERQSQNVNQVSWYGLAAALITLGAPYSIWYGQEAKVYGLLLFVAALLIWALLRALRVNSWRNWLLLAVVALAAVFVHRLAGLLLAALGWVLAARLASRLRGLRRWAVLLAPALLSGLLVVAAISGLGGEQAAGRSVAGAAIPANPPLALWLTFVRFSLDRWPGEVPLWWLLPWAALLGLGGAKAALDLRDPRRRSRAGLLLALLVVPLALFLAQLVVTRLYEARYLIIVFPAWALLLAYPLAGAARRRAQGAGRKSYSATSELFSAGDQLNPPPASRLVLAACCLPLAGALATGGLALFQPKLGLFSGDPVKEQYREVITELAARVHPDDAVVVHPGYIRPLYSYYMGRRSADPAPVPITFADFWQGETSYGQREWDIERVAKLRGFTRSFLLIAPEHARTVDKPLPGDEYGLVGLFWAYSRDQRAWPCGIWRANGAHLLCQEYPEPYAESVAAPTPATMVVARFGGNLELQGYTLKSTTPNGPGVYRAGGNLPISLFWDVLAVPDADLSLFLHLCQRCDEPPPASEDGPPLEGYLPTSSWLPGRPARDDRAIALPRDLPPGRYSLLLGVFRPDDPTPSGRLLVETGADGQSDRLVLGTVEIVAADTPVTAGGR